MPLRIALFVGFSFTLAVQPGCFDLSFIRVEQRFTLQVTDNESGQPVAGIHLYVIQEDAQSFFGDSFTTDSNGFVEIVEERSCACTTGGSLFGTPNCSEISTGDFVTGTMRTFVLEDGAVTEILKVDLQVGNRVARQTFAVEIIEITSPESQFTP